MSFQTSALLLSWVAIVLLALVVSGLVRQVHALTTGAAATQRGVGLPVGSRAPGFERLAPPSPGPLVLLFAGEDCRTCARLLPDAAVLARPPVVLRVLYPHAVPATAPVADGTLIEVRGGAVELFDAYRVVATPFAVLVDPAGRVRSSVPVGSMDALRRLLGEAEELDTVAKGVR